jgi:hypothetical protein
LLSGGLEVSPSRRIGARVGGRMRSLPSGTQLSSQKNRKLIRARTLHALTTVG